jgi:anti-sigma factor ChrR (cupin superfamily)
MADFLQHLQVHDLLDAEKTIADRTWSELRPGVMVSYFYQDDDDGMSAALLHYEANARVPRHQHLGYEHIFILDGTQQDANGIYGKGSLLIHKKNTEHDVYSKDGCIAYAVWQQPVQFV